MTKEAIAEQDPEIVAISDVYLALKRLEPEAQARVLSYVAAKLKVDISTAEIDSSPHAKPAEDARDDRANAKGTEAKEEVQDELEGISPVARKWISRNGLQAKQLWTIFSLSTDGVDLIATTVPGESKRQRMRNVFLLTGIAAYLGSGAARFSHQQVKEACLHYDAFDSANFSANLKHFSREVTGSKDTGYT